MLATMTMTRDDIKASLLENAIEEGGVTYYVDTNYGWHEDIESAIQADMRYYGV